MWHNSVCFSARFSAASPWKQRGPCPRGEGWDPTSCRCDRRRASCGRGMVCRCGGQCISLQCVSRQLAPYPAICKFRFPNIAKMFCTCLTHMQTHAHVPRPLGFLCHTPPDNHHTCFCPIMRQRSRCMHFWIRMILTTQERRKGKFFVSFLSTQTYLCFSS